MPGGKLFVVPTPIGNLKDLTFRALEILNNVELILSEDTRTSGVLLKHYNIHTPQKSHHKFNEHASLQGLIERIKTGQQIALISDAGTPGISDPGFLLMREVIQQQLDIEVLPGATAFILALLKSGFPSDRFVFEGFLPIKKGRKSRIESFVNEERTIVLYESPHRLIKALNQFKEYLPERRISISRELTKRFEETITGTIEEVIAHFEQNQPKGEFVIVIEGVKRK